MKITIEKTSLAEIERRSGEMAQFLDALKTIKAGESFKVDRLDSVQRAAIYCCQAFLEKTVITRKEGSQFRIFCLM